jgi:transposase
VSTATIYKILGKHPFSKDSTRKQTSLLVDRLHYARLIDEGIFTINQVVDKTGYKYNTVYKWITSYRTFGNKMLNNAIAFRREV